jgi:hydrogenase maturation protease
MIAVIGCGNPNRCDDGAGPEIVRMLSTGRFGEKSRGLRLLDAGTDGMSAMFAARGCHSLIIVDACRSGSEPGAIFEVPGAELECCPAPSMNLHDFRWNNALYAGRKIFRDAFPQDVTVLLIEAESLAFGIGLTPVVAESVKKVAVRIEQLVHDRAALWQCAQ